MKLFIVLFLFASGCQAQMQAWQKERFVTRLSKVESYHGKFTETGIGSSEVWFTAPASYTVVADDGAFLVSGPGTLKMYSPKTHIALIYKNLPVIAPADARKALESQFDQNVKLFDYSLGPYSKVADLETIELRFKGKGLVKSGASQVYDAYSFPLETKLNFADGSYELKFSSIEFNTNAKPAASPKIPGDALTGEWDYNSKSYTLAEAQKEASKAGFHFELPKTDLELVKIIRQKGPLTAFTAFFSKGTQMMTVLEFKDYGVEHSDRGVKISGGVIRPGAHLNSFSKSKGDTNFIYTFNGPLDIVASL